jgi:3-methyladenine DNA glycosylase AlkD
MRLSACLPAGSVKLFDTKTTKTIRQSDIKMTPEGLYKEIVSLCKANYNEAVVKKYSRYFKEGVFDSWGITTELLHGKADEIKKRKDVDFELLRKTSLILVKSRKYEETSFAFVFYKQYSAGFTRQTFNDITVWFETGITNWGHCDAISGDLMFTMLSRGIINYTDLSPWISAKNKYQRRAVPVSLIKLLKTSRDFKQYFHFIEPLMSDPQREVHQGVGWFLRESWKLNRTITEDFLLKWKDTSPRLIFQYACEKMNKVGKSRFKASK